MYFILWTLNRSQTCNAFHRVNGWDLPQKHVSIFSVFIYCIWNWIWILLPGGKIMINHLQSECRSLSTFFLLLGHWWTDYWTNIFQKINLQQDVWWYFQDTEYYVPLLKRTERTFIYIYICIWIYTHIWIYIYTHIHIYGHFWNMKVFRKKSLWYNIQTIKFAIWKYTIQCFLICSQDETLPLSNFWTFSLL